MLYPRLVEQRVADAMLDTRVIMIVGPRHSSRACRGGIANLAEGRGLFKDMSALYPALRMTRCQDHYVFCLPQQDAPARIVAIFRERMDLMKRLVDRLTE